MKLPTVSIAVAYASFLALTAAGRSTQLVTPHRSLPACSARDVEPRACPSNTIFRRSMTVAVIGAAINDVADIMYSFFDCAWTGTKPTATSGTDMTVGATRAMPLGTLEFKEKLIVADRHRDGSFVIELEQADGPVVVHNGSETYTYDGYWDILSVEPVSDNETAVAWHVYACMTLPGGYESYHEGSINNVVSMLQDRDQLSGVSTGPNSVTEPPE